MTGKIKIANTWPTHTDMFTTSKIKKNKNNKIPFFPKIPAKVRKIDNAQCWGSKHFY